MRDRKEYMKKYNEDYKKSYKGLVTRIYHHQIRNCETRGHDLPQYTFEQLLEWYIEQNAESNIHEQWIQNDCDPELVPSVDRLDSTKTYSLGNIQLVTWAKNKELAIKGLRENTIPNSGLFNGGHSAVVQFSLEGELVNHYISLAEAARSTESDHRSISACCSNRILTHNNSIWCYLQDVESIKSRLTEEYLNSIKAASNKASGYFVEVQDTNLDTSTEYTSLSQVANVLGTSPKTIRKWANNTATTRKPKPQHLIITIKEHH